MAPQLLGTGGAQATSLLKLKLKKVAAARAAAKAADKGETFVETFTVRLERGPQGFGMVLNSSNRLTSLVPGGPAAQSQLLEWDLITKLDGLKLTGQLGAVAKGRDAMVLTVERPPERCHDSIIAREAVGYETPFQSDPLLEESLPSVTPTPQPSSSQLRHPGDLCTECAQLNPSNTSRCARCATGVPNVPAGWKNVMQHVLTSFE